MNDKVEKYKRSSKCNYVYRKGHSLETVMLEKILIFDYAKKTEEANVHTISDLEVCYDRQMPELCGLVEKQ